MPTDAPLSEEQAALSAYWPFRRAVYVDMVDGCEHSPDGSHFVCGHCEQAILVRVLVPILQRFREASVERWKGVKCRTHNADARVAWGCPDCVVELRTEVARLREELEESRGSGGQARGLADESNAARFRLEALVARLRAQVKVLNEALVDVRDSAETIISTVGKGALRAVSATREELKP